MKVTKQATLEEIITAVQLTEHSYMLDPLEGINLETAFQAIEKVQGKQVTKMLRNRSFAQLTLEEIVTIMPDWILDAMVDGLDYLVKKAEEGQIYYDIWDSKEGDKDKTGILAFPLKDQMNLHKYVVICPGGGYENVCSIVEGLPIAKAWNALGYSAFILQYRVGSAAQMLEPEEDLAQAIRFIQKHAKEFHVKGDAYGVTGFSAGGHLAASFGTTRHGYAKYDLTAPEVMVLGYPVITMGQFAHEGSRIRILRDKTADIFYQKLYSVEKQVTKAYPPTFLWQCEGDACVPIENTEYMVEALKEQGIPYLYEKVPGNAHGWGLATGTWAEGWVERAAAFWSKITDS